jgi:hypothetical protein
LEDTGIDYKELDRRISEMFNLPQGSVFVLNLDKQGVLLEFAYPPKLKKNKLPVDNKTIVGRAVIVKRPYISNNVQKESSSAFLNCLMAMESDPVQKMITHPIVFGDKVISVLQVVRKGKNPYEIPDFQREDLEKIRSVLDDLFTLHVVKPAAGE